MNIKYKKAKLKEGAPYLAKNEFGQIGLISKSLSVLHRRLLCVRSGKRYLRIDKNA